VIAVESRGRLGNQMFQYAFGLAAARRLGTTLAFPDEALARLFVLGSHVPLGSTAPPGRFVSVGNDDYERPEEVLGRLADDTTYAGFFQSERFFAAAASEVRACFRPLPEHEHAFGRAYGDLVERGYVCCHMRRTDYETFAGGVALPMSYYRASLRRLDSPPGTPIVFVGDDLSEARTAFATAPAARFEHNEEILDLQLLRHARAVVVSNSSFAWWGAWLNDQPGKRVLAPRHWLGLNFGWEYPPGVIPDGWTRVRVQQPWRRRLAPARMRMSAGRARHRLSARLGTWRGRA
jgi:hypothetical protein